MKHKTRYVVSQLASLYIYTGQKIRVVPLWRMWVPFKWKNKHIKVNCLRCSIKKLDYVTIQIKIDQRERTKGNQTWSKGSIVKQRPQVNIAGAHISSTNYHCSGQIHKWCFVANSETKVQSYTCQHAILLHLLNFRHGIINIILGVFIKMLIIGLGLAYQPWLSKDSTNQFNCHIVRMMKWEMSIRKCCLYHVCILSGWWSKKWVLESVFISCATP